MARLFSTRLGNTLLFLVLAVAMGHLFLTLGNDFTPSVHTFLHQHFPARYPDDIAGTITASGDLGNWTMHPNVCHSGEPREYFGVEFFDETQPRLGGQIVLPPDGEPSVSLNSPAKGGSDTIHRGGCQLWDVDLNRTNTRYNAIWGLTGHAKFNCEFHDPESRIAADLNINNCH